MVATAEAKPAPKLVYSVQEVADLLGVHRDTVYTTVERGDLAHVRVGTRILIPAAVLWKFLGSAATVPQPAGATRAER